MVDVFDNLIDGCNSIVADIDSKGYADIYKQCTELFFAGLQNNYNINDNPIHFSDISYLDGYFMFAHGTNSVVHFRIDECPGWLFGIWWNEPKDDELSEADPKNKIVSGQFFTQYEETIDKFKPSRSEFVSEFEIYLDHDDATYQVLEIAAMIQFIHNEPYLAFCRDYLNWDYNTSYHSRSDAKREFERYQINKKYEKEYTELMDSKFIGLVNSKILPIFSGAHISDRGECVSPRYQVVAPYAGNEQFVNRPGYYGWFADDDEEGQSIIAEFKQLEAESREYEKKYNFFYSLPFHYSIVFTDKEN